MHLRGTIPFVHVYPKDTQLNTLTPHNLYEARLLSLVCNLPNAIRCQISRRCCRAACPLRGARVSSPRLESRRARSKVNLQFLIIRRLTFERPGSQRGIGGADRDRTDDPLLAKQVLSQLSYSPYKSDNGWWAWVGSNYRPHPYQGCALTN